MAIEIKYSGSVIANLEPGQIAKLSCKNTQMESDITVTVPQDEEDSPLPVEVLTEAEMDELLVTSDVGSIFKYIGTGSVYENGALYVVEVKLISFTISGAEYQAEEGMTWADWVASEYNTGRYRADGYHVSDEYSNPIENSADVLQYPTDYIIANESYNTTSGTHSGGMN